MFFTQINQMMNPGVDITLVIRKKGGQLMVSAMPRSNGLKDEAQNHIVPLTVTGTPEELDMGFLPTICRPMQKVSGLLNNMSLFEEQADKAAANSKAQKELKDKETKEAKEKKEKFDKHIKAAADFESEKKYSAALGSLQQARTLATVETLKSVDEKINTIRAKAGQGSFFDMDGNPQSPQASPVNRPPQPVPPQPQYVNPPQPAQLRAINECAGPNGQCPPEQTIIGNGYPYPDYSQRDYAGSNGQPSGRTGVYNGQAVTNPDLDREPAPTFTVDYSVHREGEYDQYPDFPGNSNNSSMYNL